MQYSKNKNTLNHLEKYCDSILAILPSTILECFFICCFLFLPLFSSSVYNTEQHRFYFMSVLTEGKGGL